ncbi:MAG TPA: hypothetical protein PKG74_03030, partial [Candidatus Colwellbacteria bacterium]|nr:hypothetical protein [Candidatus Colwellbacteria bacterium]
MKNFWKAIKNWWATSQLAKRIKSLLWRAAMYGVAYACGWIVQNLGILNLNPQITAIIGLIF